MTRFNALPAATPSAAAAWRVLDRRTGEVVARADFKWEAEKIASRLNARADELGDCPHCGGTHRITPPCNSDGSRPTAEDLGKRLVIGQSYEVRNGLGGIFDARLLSLGVSPPSAKFRVDMPLNPDWHGWEFVCSPSRVRL